LGTVSNVLNNPERVREATISKVTRAITQLGFVRNDAARQLKAGKSQTIGLVVLDASNPFFAELARGAEDAAEDAGYALLLGNSGHLAEREDHYLDLFNQQRLSGVLVSPVEELPSGLAGLRTNGTQAVLVDRKADSNLCCSVSVDDVAGGRIAVKHLIEQGRQKIAFVGGPLSIPQVADRLSGAKDAIRASKGAATLKVYKSRDMNVLAGREVGEQILKEKKETWPDAIFAANDLLAVGLIQALMFKSQVKIPGEIAVIGYDDIDFAESAVVPLSSVKQPARLLGSTALEMLVDEVESPLTHKHRQVTFQPELVVRASTVG
jgi:LacI family transcriptional regulator